MEEYDEYYNDVTDAELKKPPETPKEEKGFESDESNTEVVSPNEEENISNSIPYNTRALSKFDSTYKLETFEKNYLLILNQENINGYKPRYGTKQDVSALSNTFSKFGFEIHERTDLTKAEIIEELKTFKEKDFTDYGCVGVAVLTHGADCGLLRAKDQQYSEVEIINHFKTHDKPTLITKPKILIIQACRGTRPIQGVFVRQMAKIRKDVDEDTDHYTLPVESDMLVLHSSYKGNPSHRHELYGSWFIQTLCQKINQLSHIMDLESIITEVKRDVAIDMTHEAYNRRTFELEINKQMPVITSTLIRKLYLRKFGEKTRITFCDSEVNVGDYSPISPIIEESPEPEPEAQPEPLQLVQFGPCSCFLDHFLYLKKCLSFFVDENPNDRAAQSYLEICNTFEEGIEFNTAKGKMAKIISAHLTEFGQHYEFFKYLYIPES